MVSVLSLVETQDFFEKFRDDFIGLDCVDPVFTHQGKMSTRQRVYLDSGATTLMAKMVWEGLNDYLKNASANSHTEAHRAGRDTTEAIEESRDAVGRLVGYDPERDVVLFTSNGATGATNFLARALFPPELRLLLKRYPDGAPEKVLSTVKELVGARGTRLVDKLLERPKVVTTEMEHHSNLLPWMEAVGHHNVFAIRVKSDGSLDLNSFEEYMKKEGERVRLVAVTGLSNVTGMLNPVHKMAKIAHQYGAQILVDGAQWVPHAQVHMHTGDPEEALDYLVMSGHKLYAPGSRGALIGDLDTLAGCKCVSDVGGGMVEYVTIEDFEIKDKVTAREEAGTPNIPGSIAMGLVAELLLGIEMSVVVEKEHELTAHLLKELKAIPQVTIYGSTDMEKHPRGGVVSFNIQGIDHGLVATYLNDYHNIAVRNGCFCAQPYGIALMRCEAGALPWETSDPHDHPGMVRASLGLYSTRDHLDTLIAALHQLLAHHHEIEALYASDEHGTFRRVDGKQLAKTFTVSGSVEAYLG